jgi:hypothetical protein
MHEVLKKRAVIVIFKNVSIPACADIDAPAPYVVSGTDNYLIILSYITSNRGLALTTHYRL